MKTNNVLFVVLGLVACSSASFVAVSRTSNESDVAVVEAVVKGEELAGYRIFNVLSGKGERTLSEIPTLLECGRGHAIYLDGSGRVWKDPLAGERSQIGKTTFVAAEGAAGKVLFADEQFFAVENKSVRPGEQKGKTSFSLTRYKMDGSSNPLTSAEGRALALWSVSADVIEVVTDAGLFDVNTKTGAILPIKPLDPKGLNDVALVQDGYGFFARDGGKTIEIRKGLVGERVTQYTVEEGFGVVADFDAGKKTLLIVAVSSERRQDTLIELALTSGRGREIYKAKSIGGACYL